MTDEFEGLKEKFQTFSIKINPHLLTLNKAAVNLAEEMGISTKEMLAFMEYELIQTLAAYTVICGTPKQIVFLTLSGLIDDMEKKARKSAEDIINELKAATGAK